MSDWAATSGYAHDLVMGAVAWLFVIAGFMKLINLRSFQAAVIGYRIVPVPVSSLVSLTLPPVEVGLGFVLLCGGGGVAVPLAMVALVTIFSIAVSLNLLRGREIDCGCDGGVSPSSITWAHVYRNVALSAILTWTVADPGWSSKISSQDRSSQVLASLLLSALYVFGKAPYKLWRQLTSSQDAILVEGPS